MPNLLMGQVVSSSSPPTRKHAEPCTRNTAAVHRQHPHEVCVLVVVGSFLLRMQTACS